MRPIDKALIQLADLPAPPQLANVEARVWQRLAVSRESGIGWGMPATAVLLAMFVGIVASPRPVPLSNVADMDALSVRPALLPSTLLATR